MRLGDVSVGSKTVLTPLKSDVCVTPESRHRPAPPAMTDLDPDPFADCDAIVCCGGAKLTAKHLASTNLLQR
jgi:hypothetical protein